MNKLNSTQEVQLVKNLQPVKPAESIMNCIDYSRELKTKILQIHKVLSFLQKNAPDITSYVINYSLCGEAQKALSEYINKPEYEYVIGLLYILKYQDRLITSAERLMAKHCPFRYFAAFSPEASLEILVNDFRPTQDDDYWPEKKPYSFMTELNEYAQIFGFDFRGLEILLGRLENMPLPEIEITKCKYDMFDERCDSQFLVKYLFYRGKDISKVNLTEQYMLIDYQMALTALSESIPAWRGVEHFKNMREIMAKHISTKFFGEDKEYTPIILHEKNRSDLSRHPGQILFHNPELLLLGKDIFELGHPGYFSVIKNSFIYQNHSEEVDDLIASYYQKTGNICYLVLLRESLIFNHSLSANALNCLLNSDYYHTLPVCVIRNENNILQILTAEKVDLAIKLIDSRTSNLTVSQQEILFSCPLLEAAKTNYLMKFTPAQIIVAKYLPVVDLLKSLNKDNLLKQEVLDYIADNPLYKEVIERNDNLIQQLKEEEKQSLDLLIRQIEKKKAVEERANDKDNWAKPKPVSLIKRFWKSIVR